MRPNQLKELIVARHKNGIKRPLIVESSPGMGKTQIAAQAAEELEIGFKAIHAPLLQPEDYGFPVISKERDNVDFIVSKHKFPVVDSDCPPAGIFLIDEISQADNSGQKILANLVQEREIHGQKLKPEWTVIATGNKTTDRAGANRILTHLKNRLTTIELEPHLDDWVKWALENDVKPEVISFLRWRPELLASFNPQNEINATPRSWAEGVSAALGVVDPELEFPVFCGDVGEGPATEFLSFLKIYRKLPSIDRILLKPDDEPVTKDPATCYAVVGALTHRTTPDNFPRVIKYVNRMPMEFGVLYVRDVVNKIPEIVNTKDFIKWASGPGAKLLT
jgi:hypothetical protein